jgi:hypothetical protein
MTGAHGNDHAGNGHAEADGCWRPVGAEEVFAPGRQFRLNLTTGQQEVFEPSSNGHAGNGFDPFFDNNPFPDDEKGGGGATNNGTGDGGGKVVCKRLEPHPINSIPPRTWAYSHFLLFGCASAIGAVDGGGKGAMAVAIALSMITGKPLLGERVWRKGPVAILTYEDDEDEWKRRIAAACLEYDVIYETVIDSFHFLYRDDGDRIRLAIPSPTGRGVIFPDGAGIIAALNEIKPVLFLIDPFNHAHLLEDGNSNAMIAQVAGEVSRIAKATGVATLVLHHLRKSSTNDTTVDDLMGAVALRATFRSVRILARMVKKQADEMGIDPDEMWRYCRIAGSKENYAPPASQTQWFKLESQDLPNGAGIYVDGDNVQVLTPHKTIAAIDDMPKSVIAAIFAAIRTGPEPGELWHFIRQSKHRWAGKVISELADISEGEADIAIKAWLQDREDGPVFIKGHYDSPKHRLKKTGCIRLNETQAAKILEGYREPSQRPETTEQAPEPPANTDSRDDKSDADTAKRRTLTRNERILLNLLTQAVKRDDLGFIPPEDPEIPSGERCVPFEKFRDFACDSGVGGDIPKKQRETVKRGVDGLVAAELVGRWRGTLWLCY